METSNVIAQAGATTSAGTAKAGASSGRQSATSDFETFLRLLTTQLRNQDPLKPIDSTEFVSELATFSAVEQQVKTNETLESILASLSSDSGTLAGLSDWIGKEVRTEAPFNYRGLAVTGEAIPAPDATRATLDVRNALGEQVYSGPVDPATSQVTWDGRMSDGSGAKAGEYTLNVTYLNDDQVIGNSAVGQYALVTEVALSDGKAILTTAAGQRIDSSTVTGMRAVE